MPAHEMQTNVGCSLGFRFAPPALLLHVAIDVLLGSPALPVLWRRIQSRMTSLLLNP